MTKVDYVKITESGHYDFLAVLNRVNRESETCGLAVVEGSKVVTVNVNAQLESPASVHKFRLAVIAAGNAKVAIDANIVVGLKASGSTVQLKVLILITGGMPTVTVKPVMEVKNKTSSAIHGVSTVRLPDESYFYAGSRGLDKSKMKELLVSNVVETFTAPKFYGDQR